MVYVEQNPVRAALAEQCEDWRWSSARTHVLAAPSTLLDLVRWRERHTPDTWKRCLSMGLESAALLERIRQATLTGFPLGSDDFLDRLELQFQRPTRPRRPGPKPSPLNPTITATSTQLTLPAIPS